MKFSPVLFSFLPLLKLAFSQTQKCSSAISLVDEMDIIFCLEEIFPILFYFLFVGLFNSPDPVELVAYRIIPKQISHGDNCLFLHANQV